MKRTRLQPLFQGNFVWVSPARWTEKRCVGRGQDRDRIHDPRDFSRRPHSPLITLVSEGTSCPA